MTRFYHHRRLEVASWKARPVPQDQVHCDFRGHYRDDTYAWTDVNGDARPDLVVTQRCGEAGATGSAHWEVFSLECAD